MDKPRLILAEDYGFLRRDYVRNLRRVGFRVTSVSEGRTFYETLKARKFDLIVSDSDMPFICGDGVCRQALEEGVIDESVLIIGMSDTEENQRHWRGIANLGCFYNKANLTEGRMGEKVLNCWRLFQSGGAWRAKMPCFENTEWDY